MLDTRAPTPHLKPRAPPGRPTLRHGSLTSMLQARHKTLGIIAALGAVHTLAAQTSPTISFEAASIKPNVSNAIRRSIGFPAGRFVATNAPLGQLIAVAYGAPGRPGSEPRPNYRIAGGPDWISSDRFNVEARVSGGVVRGTEAARRIQLMLQTLLAERFKLKVITETKELPAYVLVVGKNGPKLQRSKLEEKDCTEAAATPNDIPCHEIHGGMGRGMHAKAVDMGDVTMFVENWADRPVIDQTGLTGLYELETDGWAPMRPRPARPGGEQTAEDLAMADPTRLTLFQVFDKLGLKLEGRKAPVETFVIDRVEKPTEN